MQTALQSNISCHAHRSTLHTVYSKSPLPTLPLQYILFHKTNKIYPNHPTDRCHILTYYIHTNPSAPNIFLSEILTFLKVCAFDETLVLFAFFFTSTVTYVPVESIFKTMAVLAAATTTPSFWTVTPHEINR